MTGPARFFGITALAAFILIGAIDAMAIEEARYEVIKKDKKFEIREYAPHILAETVVEGNLEEVGNKAFERLFGYISGGNQSRDKVAMTAPVSQQKMGEKIKMTAPVGQQQIGEKIEMTAPVGQQNVGESWVVSFMMPDSYTMETLPEPEDSSVTLRQVPTRRMAAVRYSGFWSEKGYLKHKDRLESWIQRMGLTIVGDPIWARYNAPFVPWFLRRNEILIPVDAGGDQEKSPQ